MIGKHMYRFFRNLQAVLLYLRKTKIIVKFPRRSLFSKRHYMSLDSQEARVVTVIIPTLNEQAHIQDVIQYVFNDPITDQVVVVDDGSIDETVRLAEQAGAVTVTSSMLGKGASMQDGLELARNEVVVYLDGDLMDLEPGIVSKLAGPIFEKRADFVKARFGRSGGRVTELTAKPMVKIFFPELSSFAQPLGGIIAARKSLLRQLPFEDGYGVDIGLLIDAHMKGAKITEVDIGHLRHDSQPLHDLTSMANEVSRVIFQRAKQAGRLHVDQIVAMFETQRQAQASLSYVLSRYKGQKKLLLLDMDGTVLCSRYAVELAKACGKENDINEILQTNDIDARTNTEYEAMLARTKRVTDTFRFVHKKVFEQTARTVELREGVVEFVKEMRRKGFMVGLVTDSYYIAAEIIRRRIFADFALGHTLSFQNDVCTGEVQLNQVFLSSQNGKTHICKSNVLSQVLADVFCPDIEAVWAVGDNVNDLEMLRQSDRGFLIDPKVSVSELPPNISEITTFHDILDIERSNVSFVNTNKGLISFEGEVHT